METIKQDSVYVLGDQLVLMASQELRPLQALAKPSPVMEFLWQAATECKKTAGLVASAVVTKFISAGRSIFKYLEKDFLKKEGVPLKGLFVYNNKKKIGKFVKGVIQQN